MEMGVGGGWGTQMMASAYGVPWWKAENVLGVDCGDGYTTLQIHNELWGKKPINYTLN